jgi:hypothetical protein
MRTDGTGTIALSDPVHDTRGVRPGRAAHPLRLRPDGMEIEWIEAYRHVARHAEAQSGFEPREN